MVLSFRHIPGTNTQITQSLKLAPEHSYWHSIYQGSDITCSQGQTLENFYINFVLLVGKMAASTPPRDITRLEALGYAQELKRNIGMFETFGFVSHAWEKKTLYSIAKFDGPL